MLFRSQAYFDNPSIFEIVTTNCRTGKAAYLTEKKDKERALSIVKASSSLPYVCPIVDVDGEPMLDGGIIDSIPVARARKQGYKHNVVVLTRNRGYRETGSDIRLPYFVYREYPRLRVVLSRRIAAYNEQLNYIEELEDKGEITVIRPIHPLVVTRLETNIERLTNLYDEGYECARAAFAQLEIAL